MADTKIQIIVGSSRPGRTGKSVGDWVLSQTESRTDADFELVDVADFNLPLIDEAVPPMMNQYSQEHSKKWGEKIAEADGYIFVTPEYNHAMPGNFKNAVDFLYHEWTNKSLGFVGYGVNGGLRAIEQWRQVAAQLQMGDVREEVLLDFATQFNESHQFVPTQPNSDRLQALLDQVVQWAEALKVLRIQK